MPMVFPINILYPLLLEVIPGTKSRAAALVNVARLVVSAICIEAVSYVYDGRFLQLGLTIAGLSIITLIFAKSSNYWKNSNVS
jgi:DHA1 family bicyclomycin/chloramphenicol resistance-like MFS transporter